MTLLHILIGTFLAGVGSVLIAALLARALLSRLTQHLLSLAAGALLATAFVHLLPEAFESGTSSHRLFLTLLIGVVFFFLLDKAELWHHGHEHSHHDHHHHGHHHHGDEKISGSWAVLLGDSIHAFGDGILVAAAFLVDTTLGVAASVAILAHEVPHHIGDLIVLQQSTHQPQKALIKLCLAGGVTVLGGLCGFALIAGHQSLLPYLLTIASSSYIYVALADLIPQLQKRLGILATLAQIIWLFAGITLVTISTSIFNQ
ncbi:MAG: ZIP family metal transporter [Limnohabitans sp.]|nr:ZIP family metal transporter [Limnohabitans sp.]